MKVNVRSYNVIGTFFRHEFTNIPGMPAKLITPLLLGIYDFRKQLRHEVYAKEWKGEAGTPRSLIASSKIKLDKVFMVIYLPLIHISALFLDNDEGTVDVVPCSHQFINSENDYDPGSIYFYRIATQNNEPKVLAMCRYMFNINDILELSDGQVTYQYLVAAYVDMFESVLSDIDEEYKIAYILPYKESNNYSN